MEVVSDVKCPAWAVKARAEYHRLKNQNIEEGMRSVLASGKALEYIYDNWQWESFLNQTIGGKRWGDFTGVLGVPKSTAHYHVCKWKSFEKTAREGANTTKMSEETQPKPTVPVIERPQLVMKPASPTRAGKSCEDYLRANNLLLTEEASVWKDYNPYYA